MNTEQELIKYFQSLGIVVNTTTKARGHFGFFLNGRIDISIKTPKEKIIPTLLHEFAHYIHSKIEKNIAKTGGHLEIIFNTNDNIENELIKITNITDTHSKCETLIQHRNKIKEDIKQLDNKIKQEYPKFQRSKPFKEFNKAIRGTNLKYLLKYDKIKIMPWFFLGKEQIISINSIETDFPNLQPAFANYIKLKSLTRKQRRISNKISKIQRYYKRPTELFARFVEAIYNNEEKVKLIAPQSYKIFKELLTTGCYKELNQALKIAKGSLFIV